MRKKIGTLFIAGAMLLSQVAGPMASSTVKAAAVSDRTVTVYDYVDMSGATATQITGSSNLNTQQTSADNTTKGWTLGGEGQTGYVDLALTVDATEGATNYVTVKLWGNDVQRSSADGVLYVAVPVTVDNDTKYQIGSDDGYTTEPSGIASGRPDTNYMVALSNLSENKQYEDGYIYSTYYIPTWAISNGIANLRIYSGPNQSYYSGYETAQRAASRTMYGLWITTEPCMNADTVFVDKNGDAVDISLDLRTESSTLAESPYSTTNQANMNTVKANLASKATSAIDMFKNRQIYGGSNYPDYMEGQMTRSTGWKTEGASTDWKTSYYMKESGMLEQNFTPINGLEAFSYAYTSDFYTTAASAKQELFDRIIAGLDFLVRAQGSNGGFCTESAWIGATSFNSDYDGRTTASGNNLTGFGLRSAAQAFLLLNGDASGKSALESALQETITDYDADNADDGSNAVNRAIAYGVMFASARDFLVHDVNGIGHAPNQDMANIIAALRFDQGCKIIDDYLKTNTSITKTTRIRQYQTSLDSNAFAVYEDKEYGYPYSWESTVAGQNSIKETIEIGLGYRTSKAFGDYWISKKGIILENLGSLYGSYSGDYGTNAVIEVSDIVELAEDYYKATYPDIFSEDYNQILNQVYDAVEPYYFLQNENGNPVLYTEGVISHRNISYYPGTERYPIDLYGIMLSQSEYPEASAVSGTIMKYYLEHGKVMEDFTSAHFEDEALEAMKLYNNFDNILSCVKTTTVQNYQFSSEIEETQVYADEMARNVVIRDNGETYYIALNWRNWMASTYGMQLALGNPVEIFAHNLARIHHVGQGFDQIGYAKGTSVDIATERNNNAANELYHESRYLEGLMSLRYGKYTIIMNTNGATGSEYGYRYAGHGNTYTLAQSGYSFDEDENYKDLVTGTIYTGADLSSVTIQPETTMVLVKYTTEVTVTTDRITSYAVNGNSATQRANSSENESAASDIYYLNEIVTGDEENKEALIDDDTTTTAGFGATRIVFVDMGEANVTKVELYGADTHYCFATGRNEAPSSIKKGSPVTYIADAAIPLNGTTGYNTGDLTLTGGSNSVLTITSDDMDFGRYLILDMNGQWGKSIAEIKVYSEETETESWDLAEGTNAGYLVDKRISEVNSVLEERMGDFDEWSLYTALTYNQQKGILTAVSQKTTYKKAAAVLAALKSEINRVVSVEETENQVGIATLGAQIRDVADKNNKDDTTLHDFRFRSLINKDLHTSIEENGGQFGTILIPTQALTLAGMEPTDFTLNSSGGIRVNSAMISYAQIQSKVFFDEHEDDDTIPYKEFTGVLTGLTEAYRSRSFTARTYYIPASCLDDTGAITNYDGIIYGRPISRTLCTVAQTVLDSETELTEVQEEVLRDIAYIGTSANKNENEVDTGYWGDLLQN